MSGRMESFSEVSQCDPSSLELIHCSYDETSCEDFLVILDFFDRDCFRFFVEALESTDRS